MNGMILPPPDVAFEWRCHGTRPALVCPRLDAIARHLFTTEAWILGRHTAGNSDEGWREVAAAVGSTFERLVRVRQVHGSRVVVAAPGTPSAVADIIVSDDPSVAIVVQSADCVPLLIADPDTGAVAAAHAGWRGLARHVPEVAVAALETAFGSRASRLLVALGPSVGACCYEVGLDVREAFATAGFAADRIDRWFPAVPQPTDVNPRLPSVTPEPRYGRWFFDGWRSAREQLLAAGVSADRILSAGLCTASHPGVFCSYRRDGARAGRMAAVIMSRPRRP